MSNQANAATQEVAQTTNVPTQYTVSPNTAMFLDLLKGYNELYDSIYSAIQKCYGVTQVEKLFDRDFEPILQPLRDEIFEYVKSCISHHSGNTI